MAIGARSADETAKLLAALDEVKSNNVSPSTTEKTYLIEGITQGPATKPALLRPAVTACLITALISLFIAASASHFLQSEPAPEKLNAAEQPIAAPTPNP